MCLGIVCDVTHCCVWRDSFLCVTLLILMCDMIMCQARRFYLWCASVLCVTWLIPTRVRRWVWWGAVFWWLGTWLLSMRDMTRCYEWRDLFLCVTWFGIMCDWLISAFVTAFVTLCMMGSCLSMIGNVIHSDLNHFYAWFDSLWYVTWLIHVYDMTRFDVCRDSSLRSSDYGVWWVAWRR